MLGCLVNSNLVVPSDGHKYVMRTMTGICIVCWYGSWHVAADTNLMDWLACVD